MSGGVLLILCLVGLAAADLRMASQPRYGFQLVNQGTTKWNIQNGGDHMHYRYMEPSTFGYAGLRHQKARNYDNFLRSNIDNEQDNRNFNDEDGKDHLPFRTDEAAGTREQEALQDLGGSGCTSSSKCSQCQGDCDTDADCDDGLYCFQRDSSSQLVPGCAAGGKGDVGDHDYCTQHRTPEARVHDIYPWDYGGRRRRIPNPPMKLLLSRSMVPGESMVVPLRWNNPHSSEMEVNIWIFEHAGEHPVVVPIRKPSCSGEGYQDNVISFTVPKDFNTLGAKIPGFKGCNADSQPQCTLQIYSHSVESRTYALGFPIVIKASYDAEADSNSSIQKASEDPWLDLSGLRDICLPATDPSATITSATPRWARLVSDVYNHAYQNSDYSPYSGQQHESISKNLQASAVNKMVASNRGELGKAILPKETDRRLRYLRSLESKIYKNYESLANKVINAVGKKMENTGTVGVDDKVQQLATCFRCSESGSTNTKRLQTNTYIPSFQLPQDLVPEAKKIVGTKYAKLISESGLVQIYVASLNDLLPFFYEAAPLGIIYQPAVVKLTIGTMLDDRNFKKRDGENKPDGGRSAATLAKHKVASDLNCPTKCLYPTAAQGALQNLGVSGCTKKSKCSRCQGDCDTDADCEAGLYCFQRDKRQVVPGCAAGGSGDLDSYDFCYQHVLKAGEVALQNLGGSGCTSSSKCSQCQGDCDRDSDCDDGLYCFQRRSSSQLVPGCGRGGKGDVGSSDYCAKRVPEAPQSSASEVLEKALIKGALATNTTGDCHPCVQFFGKEVHPVTEPDLTPLAKDIMDGHVPENMGANNLDNNPDDQPHTGDVKMNRHPNSVRRRRRRRGA